jgi:hypothetical protein
VPDRTCLPPEASAQIARETVLPFLRELAGKETSPRLKRRIDRSLEEIEGELRKLPAPGSVTE